MLQERRAATYNIVKKPKKVVSGIIFNTKYPLVEMNEPFITVSGFVLSVLN
jgi:hypothetical protein